MNKEFLNNDFKIPSSSQPSNRRSFLIYKEEEDSILNSINDSNPNKIGNNTSTNDYNKDNTSTYPTFKAKIPQTSKSNNHLYYRNYPNSIKRRSINKISESIKEEYTRIIPLKQQYSNMDNIKGALLMTFSAFIYAFLLMLQKYIFTELPNISFGQQNIFRGFILMLINASIVRHTNNYFFFKEREINVTLAKRVLFGFFAELLLFLGTGFLRINTSSTFYILYSVICSLVSGIVLNELITKKDIVIIVSCFLAACLIVKPFFGSGEDTFAGIIMGLSSSIGFCMMVIYHKFLDPKVSNYTINFYFGVCYFFEGLVDFSLGDDVFVWTFKAMFFLILLSLIYTFSCYLYIVAINFGKVSYVLPFENTNVVFSLLLGHFVLGESCDWLDVIGTVTILALCIYRCLALIQEDDIDEMNQIKEIA